MTCLVEDKTGSSASPLPLANDRFLVGQTNKTEGTDNIPWAKNLE